MPSGERFANSRGFTWWGLLLVLALSGAALSALGRSWSVQLQREREAELRFRGEQIREAIGRYRQARQPAAWPVAMEDLLTDSRGPLEGSPRHHLRRLWSDPFTGRADWELLPAPPPQSGFVGVRSRADVPRLATSASREPGAPAERVSDWRFEIATTDHTASAATGQPGRADRPDRPRGGTTP